jgi:nucleotide-binding universal stress UspA family protein
MTMQSKWNVLAPIDLAADTDTPVGHALDAAGKIDAELTLLYVADDLWYKRARRLGWLGTGLAGGQMNIDVHRLVLAGPVPETIARYAELIDADFVLLASRDSGWWSRLWKRSVVDEVMKATKRPVFVTNRKSLESESPFNCRQILCLLNLDGTDDAMVMHAQRLAQRSGGSLILLGAIPEASEGLLVEFNLRPNRPLSRSAAASRIREIGESLSVPYRSLILTGTPGACLRAAAGECAADIAVVSRGIPGFPIPHSLDARSTLQALPCPLLSVAWRTPPARYEEEAKDEAVPVLMGAGGHRGRRNHRVEGLARPVLDGAALPAHGSGRPSSSL